MGGISAETHQFHCEQVLGNGKCLYSSFLFGIKPVLKDIFGDVPFTKDLMNVLNDGLRMLVAGYIHRHREMHETILKGFPEYKDIEEYCSKTEQGILWGGQPELKALSDLYKISICVINPKKFIKKNCLSPWYYGEDNRSATKCIYIYYNGTNHYDLLYMVNMKNTNEIETMFDPNDQTVNDLLRKYIKEELHRNVDVELGLNISIHVEEVSRPINDSNQIKAIVSSILTNKSMKRKVSKVDEIPMSSNNNKTLPIPNSNQYYDQYKRVKILEYAPDQLRTSSKNNCETMEMEELIQADTTRGESGARDTQVNEKQTTDLPMVLNNEHQKEKIEVKQEPGNKLDDGIQENDTLNDNSESSS